MKKFTLLASLGALAFVAASSVQAASFTFDGAAAAFSQNGGTIAGVGTNGATVETTATPNGFNNFFSSDYGRLGVLNGGNITGGAFGGAGAATGAYNNLVFTAADVSGTIAVFFDYAYVTTSVFDEFSVQFFDPASGTSIPIDTIFAPTSFGTNIGFVLQPGNLIAGVTYNLLFTLTENTGDGNSAVGFDNVRVNNAPEPFTIAGLLLAAGAGMATKRSRKNA